MNNQSTAVAPMQQETESFLEVNTQVVYQQDKAQIDVQISTAKAYPRDVQRAVKNSLAIVSLDAETAESCTYALPRGGKKLSGPSVHLAKILAQNWGNLRIDAKVVEISDKQVTSEAVCFDLENNIAIKTQVKRSIMTKSGRMNDDMITVTGNAANSIALRNAVLSVIPRPVVDKVYKAAINTITGDLSTEQQFMKKRDQVIKTFFDKYGITEAQLLEAIGKPNVATVTQDDLVVWIGIGSAIKNGETTVEAAFSKSEKKATQPADEQVSEDFIHAVGKAQTQDDFDIITNSFPEADTEVGKRYINSRKAELSA